MPKKELLFATVFSMLTFGCASTDPTIGLSAGGQLLVHTNISSANTLKNYSEAQTKAAREFGQHTNSYLLNSNLIFGSGLVGSTLFFAENGVWVNPSNFLDKASLGMFAADILLGKGMSHHPWTYTYFFNQSDKCNERDCVEDNLEAFSRDIMVSYFKHPAASYKESSVIEIEYARSNFLAGDRFSVFGNFNDPQEKRNPRWRLIHVPNLDRISVIPKSLWGNYEPSEYQDNIGLPGLDYEQTVGLMIEVSNNHPEILVYVGIDRERQKSKSPCFGGFFIQSGQTIPVEEIGCMKIVSKKS